MTSAAKVWNTAKQQCLDLELEPTVDNANKLIRRGGSSVKNMRNYNARSEITDISQKPYTNEFGDQEAFGSICDRNIEYAEQFVDKNYKKFQGGVSNMTNAAMYIVRCQRERLNMLTVDDDTPLKFKSSRKS